MSLRLFLIAPLAAFAVGMPPAIAGEAVQGVAVKTTAISFQAPLVLRGTLGEEQVQMRLRPKAVADEGIEGDYFVFGRSGTILLAGEPDGTGLYLEESENGKDVSGHWDAQIDGDTISGEWTAAGGGASRRFVLKLMSPETKTPRARQGAIKPAAASTQ